jgi:hypothetical protein
LRLCHVCAALPSKAEDSLWVGTSPAIVADRPCYELGDPKAGEFSVMASGRGAELFDRAFWQGDLPGAQALRFCDPRAVPCPARCPIQTAIGNELLWAD